MARLIGETMANTDLVVAFRLQPEIEQIAAHINRDTEKYWRKDAPLILDKGYNRRNNSFPNIPIARLFLDEKKIQKVEGQIIGLLNDINPAQVPVSMQNIELTGDELRWHCDIVPHHEFTRLRNGLVSGTRRHKGVLSISDDKRNRSFEDLFILVARIEGETPWQKLDLPNLWRSKGLLTHIVLGRRGLHGSISDVFATIPLI